MENWKTFLTTWFIISAALYCIYLLFGVYVWAAIILLTFVAVFVALLIFKP